MRRTKLVCTIGPATVDRLDELIAAGMDVARLNFSHGTDAEHVATAQRVRAAAAAAGTTVAVLADLPGPKVRLGSLPGDELVLGEGDELRLGPDMVSHPGLASDVRPGDLLLLADGAVQLRVEEVVGDEVRCTVLAGGRVRSGAGLNVPSHRLSLPAITERDTVALEAILALRADYVAQSFVRRADDLRSLRRLMGGRAVPIMAKIETGAAIDDLTAILAEADAVMLARGDLGVELPFARVPVIQKQVVAAGLAACVPVVVATQMLESMVSAPRPTRAEASDVANAVLDGAAAVMLSAETAIGAHPIAAARAATGICRAAEEAHLEAGGVAVAPRPHDGSGAAAIAAAAVAMVRQARETPISAIACFTRTGLTARLLSARRPAVPIYALAPDAAVAARLALLHAVVPIAAERPDDTDALIELADASLRTAGLETGSRVLIVASIPFGAARTNFLKLHEVGR